MAVEGVGRAAIGSRTSLDSKFSPFHAQYCAHSQGKYLCAAATSDVLEASDQESACEITYHT